MRTTRLATLTFLCLALAGCVGGNHRLHFDTVEVPVSLSSSVLDADGTIVPRSRQLFKGRFEGEYRGWSTLWTFVDLNTIDLSEDINRRVAELEGDAVVRLRCQVCNIGSASNMVLWINMLPFWVGAVKVHVDADIVQVLPRAAPEPLEPEPPPTPEEEDTVTGDSTVRLPTRAKFEFGHSSPRWRAAFY